MKLWTLAWQIILSLTLLIVACVQAFQGDWYPAIFFAIMWVGHTNNSSNTILSYAIQPDQSKLIRSKNTLNISQKGQWN